MSTSSGGLTGKSPFDVSPVSATAVQLSLSIGLVSALGGFGATAQNVVTTFQLGNLFSAGLSGFASASDIVLAMLQKGCP